MKIILFVANYKAFEYRLHNIKPSCEDPLRYDVEILEGY